MAEHLDSKECTGCERAVAEYPRLGISIMCAYCDSPLVDSKAAMGHIDRVAPFRIQRSVAEQKLKEHLAGHFWAPNEIKKGFFRSIACERCWFPFGPTRAWHGPRTRARSGSGGTRRSPGR